MKNELWTPERCVSMVGQCVADTDFLRVVFKLRCKLNKSGGFFEVHHR